MYSNPAPKQIKPTYEINYQKFAVKNKSNIGELKRNVEREKKGVVKSTGSKEK